jgi:hypothetical protein
MQPKTLIWLEGRECIDLNEILGRFGDWRSPAPAFSPFLHNRGCSCRRCYRSGHTDFPESMTATTNGTLFFSSLAGGRIFRAEPGAAQASEWIKQGTNGLASAIAVLADDKSNTVYVCSSDLSLAGIMIPTGATPTAIKTFDLKSGAAKGNFTLPASTVARPETVLQRHRRLRGRNSLRDGLPCRPHPPLEAKSD